MDPDELCGLCPHTRGEHQPACIAHVVMHQREQFCGCPSFEPAEHGVLGYA